MEKENPQTVGFADIVSARHGQEAPLKAMESRVQADKRAKAHVYSGTPSTQCPTCERHFPHWNKKFVNDDGVVEDGVSGEPTEATTWTMDNHAILYH